MNKNQLWKRWKQKIPAFLLSAVMVFTAIEPSALAAEVDMANPAVENTEELQTTSEEMERNENASNDEELESSEATAKESEAESFEGMTEETETEFSEITAEDTEIETTERVTEENEAEPTESVTEDTETKTGNETETETMTEMETETMTETETETMTETETETMTETETETMAETETETMTETEPESEPESTEDVNTEPDGEEAEYKKVIINYNKSEIESLNITIDGIIAEPSSVTENTDGKQELMLFVKNGHKLLVEFNVCKGYSSSCKVEINQEGVSKVRNTKRWQASITQDTQLTIEAVKTEACVVLKQVHDDGRLIEMTNTSTSKTAYYSVIQGYDYVASVKYGHDEIKLTRVRLSSSRDSTGTIRAEDPTKADIHLGSDARIGRAITVTVSGETDQGEAVTAKARLVIAQKVQSVTDADIKVRVDGQTTYRIRDNKYGDFSDIEMEVVWEEGIPKTSAGIEWLAVSSSASIRVTTGPKTPLGTIATVKLYHKNAQPSDNDYYVNGTIKITVTEPEKLLSATPNVKIKSSDDISMTLELTGFATESVPSCRQGGQYFMISAVPRQEEGKEIPEEILEAAKKTYFVEKDIYEYDEDDEDDEGVLVPATMKVVVNNASIGQPWKYDIKVVMIQTYDKTIPLTEANMNEQIAYRSQEKVVEASTKKAAFSSTIKLKKGKTTIYTTQQNVVAADIILDAGTARTAAEASDITNCAEGQKLKAEVTDEGKLMISAPQGTKLGKHTLEVMPIGPATLYRPKTKIDITVLKGIESLDMTVSSTKIYNTSGIKATVKYNADAKTKKVKWSIVESNGFSYYDGNEDADYDESKEKTLCDYVTISNSGAVKVKKFPASVLEEGDEYSFYIEARAADFVGNEVVVQSEEIIISQQPLEIGELILAQPDNSQENRYKVVAKDGDTVTIDGNHQMRDTVLMVLKKDVGMTFTAGESYSKETLSNAQISVDDVIIKSSNAKAISLFKKTKENGFLVKYGKAADNVKITVTSSDGGKKNAVMKLSVKYEPPKALKLSMKNGEEPLITVGNNENAFEFSGTVNSKITVDVLQSFDNATWDTPNGYTDYAVKVTGGKILGSSGSQYTVIVTGKEATLTLQDKGNKKTDVYTLRNTAYSSENAPKVSAMAKTNKNLTVGGTIKSYTMKYSVSGGTSFDGKFVWIELDAASEMKNAVSRENYAKLKGASESIGKPIPVLKNGMIELVFADTREIPSGTYKLTFTFGTMTENGQFVADVKPVTVTLKAVAYKAVKDSSKLTKVYTMEAKPGASVELVLTGKYVDVEYNGLYGKNVDMVENKFLNYFELDKENKKIVLKNTLTADEIGKVKTDKSACTGYVTYTAIYKDVYEEEDTVTNTVEITINLQ